MPRRKPAGNPNRAVAYVRVSTEEQQLGPEAQRAAIAAWAKAKGIEVVATFEDLGVSGGAEITDCPGLTAALDTLSSAKAGHLVVAKRDRLARDVVKAAIVERLAAHAGARVGSADGVGDGDDPAAALLRTMVDAFAQYERAMIKQRVKAALAVKKSRGERAGGIPYGHRLADDGKHLELDAVEQKVLAKARELRAEGESLRAIGAKLEAAGSRPRTGGRWHPQVLRRLVA